MAATASPVTPDVLRWAVDEDGRTPEDVAAAIRVDAEVLLEWMSGTAAPTRGQVSKLATVLQRPRALFFLPGPPASATLPASFRHPPGEDRAVSMAARRRVRQARRLQHAVAWARSDVAGVDVPRAALAESPVEVAARARAWLGVGDEEQASWRDDRAALDAWRRALEGRGILVFLLEIGRGDVRGFSAWDDHAPLIVANLSGVAPAARSYTLAHELGHLVTRQDAACLEPTLETRPGARVERWCERFGAVLLVPEQSLRHLATQRGIRDGTAGVEDVKAVMRRFRVSARAAALRLIEQGYGDLSLYAHVASVFRLASPRTRETPMARPPRHVARLREYGPDTVRTVLAALPERDAMNLLRITVEDVRQMASEIPGVASL